MVGPKLDFEFTSVFRRLQQNSFQTESRQRRNGRRPSSRRSHDLTFFALGCLTHRTELTRTLGERMTVMKREIVTDRKLFEVQWYSTV